MSLLKPYHKNHNKRLVKSPKLYFYDTGLACSLLELDNGRQLQKLSVATVDNSFVVYGGTRNFQTANGKFVPWTEIGDFA